MPITRQQLSAQMNDFRAVFHDRTPDQLPAGIIKDTLPFMVNYSAGFW
jgi:hypothetical protein